MHGANNSTDIDRTGLPGGLHGVLGQVDVPVDQVEEGEGQGEEDAGVRVDGAGAGQLWDLRERGALLEEYGHRWSISRLTAAHRVVSPLQAFLGAAVHLVGGGGMFWRKRRDVFSGAVVVFADFMLSERNRG